MSNLVQTSFDYDALSPETRQFVQQKTDEIHGQLKRTAEGIIKKEIGHGKYEQWLSSEFQMSLSTALKFTQVAARFGDKSVNFTDLSASVLYELAAPSTPDTIVEEVIAGTIDPDLTAIKEAKDALKKAEEAEREARQEAEVLQQQLLTSTQATIDAQEQASRLTKQIEQLHQEITTISTPQTIVQEKEVTPPEVKAQLERLHQKIITLTEQRNNLSEEAKRLGEEARAVTFQRNEQKHHDRTREQWRRVSGDIHTTLLKLITHLPSPVDTQVFEAEDWTRLTQTTETVDRCLHECRRLESRIQMIVDSE